MEDGLNENRVGIDFVCPQLETGVIVEPVCTQYDQSQPGGTPGLLSNSAACRATPRFAAFSKRRKGSRFIFIGPGILLATFLPLRP